MLKKRNERFDEKMKVEDRLIMTGIENNYRLGRKRSEKDMQIMS